MNKKNLTKNKSEKNIIRPGASSGNSAKEQDGGLLKKSVGDSKKAKAIVKPTEERKIGPFPDWKPTKELNKVPPISMKESYRDLLPVVKIFIGQAYDLPKQGVYFKISIGTKKDVTMKTKTVYRTNYPVFDEEATIIIEHSERNGFLVQVQCFAKKGIGLGAQLPIASCSFDLVDTLGMSFAGDVRKYKFPLSPCGEVDITFTAETDMVFPTIKMADVIGQKDTSGLETYIEGAGGGGNSGAGVGSSGGPGGGEPAVVVELVIYQALGLMVSKKVLSLVEVYVKSRNKTKTLFKTKTAPGLDPYWNDSGGGKEEGTIELPVESFRDLLTKTESQRWFNISILGGLLGLGFKAITNPEILDKPSADNPSKVSMDGGLGGIFAQTKKDQTKTSTEKASVASTPSTSAASSQPANPSTSTGPAPATGNSVNAGGDSAAKKENTPAKPSAGIVAGNPFLADDDDDEDDGDVDADGTQSDSDSGAGGGIKSGNPFLSGGGGGGGSNGIKAGNPFLDGGAPGVKSGNPFLDDASEDDFSSLASEVESVLESDEKESGNKESVSPKITVSSTGTSTPNTTTNSENPTAAAIPKPEEDINIDGMEQGKLGELIKTLLSTYNAAKKNLEDELNKMKVQKESEDKDFQSAKEKSFLQLKQQQEEELLALQQKHQQQQHQHQLQFQQKISVAHEEYNHKLKRVNESAQSTFRDLEKKIRTALSVFKQKQTTLSVQPSKSSPASLPSPSTLTTSASTPSTPPPSQSRYSELKLACGRCKNLFSLSALVPLNGQNFCRDECAKIIIAKQAQIRQSRAAELLASPSFHSSGQQQLLQHLQQERLKYLQLEEGSAGERRRIRESQGGIDSEDEVDDDDEGEDQDSDNASSEGEEDQEIRGSGWGLGPRGRSLSGNLEARPKSRVKRVGQNSANSPGSGNSSLVSKNLKNISEEKKAIESNSNGTPGEAKQTTNDGQKRNLKDTIRNSQESVKPANGTNGTTGTGDYVKRNSKQSADSIIGKKSTPATTIAVSASTGKLTIPAIFKGALTPAVPVISALSPTGPPTPSVKSPIKVKTQPMIIGTTNSPVASTTSASPGIASINIGAAKSQSNSPNSASTSPLSSPPTSARSKGPFSTSSSPTTTSVTFSATPTKPVVSKLSFSPAPSNLSSTMPAAISPKIFIDGTMGQCALCKKTFKKADIVQLATRTFCNPCAGSLLQRMKERETQKKEKS